MKIIFWKGYSKEKRHTSIDTIKNIVAKYGDLVDFKFFSDISLTMVIEIEEFKIDNLYSELGKNIEIENFQYLNSTSMKERTVFLNITFSKSTGNLNIETPSIPG